MNTKSGTFVEVPEDLRRCASPDSSRSGGQAGRHSRRGVRLSLLEWGPLVLLPATVLAWGELLPPWALMWCLALGIFAGSKWLTFRQALRGQAPGSVSRCLAYFCLWPGMDATPFLRPRRRPFNPSAVPWISSVAKIALGSVLIWGLARHFSPAVPLVAGWIGMIGLALLLHFGLFHLLATAWRAAGTDVRPIMRNPMLATSLSGFWGSRWNTAFNDLAHGLVFRPLASRAGLAWAILGTFAASGVIHDLVISVPAGAGYGLPSAYFLWQALGVLLERTRAGKAAGLGRGWRGWLFVAVWTAGPAFWLFHPSFVSTVMLPFLRVIGALPAEVS